MNKIRNMAKSKDANHPWIEMDDISILKSSGLYGYDFSTGKEGFNLASVLLLGKDETIRSCLPAYKTDAIYRVDNMDRYDDREDIRTNLIDSYDKLIDFIYRHTDEKFFLNGTQRISARSIIAREIVSNILMHREYSSSFPAKLIIEKNRIMTENANKTYRYGKFDLNNFTPYPKNPIIANFFNNIGRADELGSGVRNLYKYTKIYSDKEPVIFEDDIFKVEIPLKKNQSSDKVAISSDKILIGKFEDKEYVILQFIKKNGSISNSQACKILNQKSATVRKLLKKMVDKSIIQPIGEKRGRIYKLKK